MAISRLLTWQAVVKNLFCEESYHLEAFEIL